MTTLTSVPRRNLMLSGPVLRRFLGMLAAVVIGMLVLGPLWPLPATAAARTDVAALVMATSSAVAVAVWMWHRGHTTPAIRDMTAALYAPFLLLLVPWWAGLISGPVVMLAGHLLILPAVALAMLRRPAEYAGHTPVVRTGPVATVLSRWPTALALAVTLDMLIDPGPLPLVSMMVLPLGYLVIGAVRRALRPRPVLTAQVAALAGYLVLLGVAVLADPETGQYLLGAGWIVHAGWDMWHHRRNLVVPRPFAEWCAVFDLIVGISVILAATQTG